LWWLLTLVPVIGLVQVGSQAMADRYMYIPIVGLLIILVWGWHELISIDAGMLPCWRAVVLAIVVAACTVLAHRQTAVWADSVTLFRHALAVTGPSSAVHYGLGLGLANDGRTAAAIPHYREAIRLMPTHARAHNNLGLALAEQGRFDEAMAHYRAAIDSEPYLAAAYNNLGLSLAATGRIPEAMDAYATALRLDPGNHNTFNNIGLALTARRPVRCCGGIFSPRSRASALIGRYTLQPGQRSFREGGHRRGRTPLPHGPGAGSGLCSGPQQPGHRPRRSAALRFSRGAFRGGPSDRTRLL
jgi:hypothetical protein